MECPDFPDIDGDDDDDDNNLNFIYNGFCVVFVLLCFCFVCTTKN